VCFDRHIKAAIAELLHYQSLDPEPVGRRSSIALDHMSGLSAVLHSLDAIGEHGVDPETASEILALIKRIGQTGRVVDLEELRLIVAYLRREHALHPTERAV
jgi:2-isopropylmalate synthase